jgi:hypothetical protein
MKSFPDQEKGETFRDKLEHFHEFKEHLKNVDYDYYIISPDNYFVLTTRRDIDEYIRFKRENN